MKLNENLLSFPLESSRWFFRGSEENSSVDIGLTAAARKNLSGKLPERGRMVLPFVNISLIQIIFASCEKTNRSATSEQ
jgi:hypothetical protein